MSHHVVGNAVAEDEDLPVAEDFARGLILLLGCLNGLFLFFNFIIIKEIAPTRSQLVVSNGTYGYMNIAVFADAIKSTSFTHGRRGCIAIYVNEFATISKRTFSNACYGVRDGDRGEGGAFKKRIPSNAGYGVGEGDGGEGGAKTERIVVSNACYGVRDGDRGEGGAFKKRTFSNAGYGVGDGDGGEGGAKPERSDPNAGYGVGEGDGGEGGATTERFASDPLSSCLNGICA